ncbi:MAG: bifunctional homocysteine S-methyltransferase/methylenetetrahydrofolate reductase [Chloroflexi bacterium]|nr:bifunctional homocysteine S-methyltransferase/methylenetetrahydrofolate reductase [Chloroflexota bacterium]
MAQPFLERLNRGPILCDGAMGTMLYARGIPFTRCFDELNISKEQRELVLGIHLEYIKAGAEILETNTFAANRLRLVEFGLEDKVRDINFQGVKLAKEARDISGQPIFLAGAIGPIGANIAPIGDIDPEEAYAAFKEQTEALLEGGADVILIESFSDLQEAIVAVRAVRDSCDLPVIAQLSFAEDGHTWVGHHSPAQVVKDLTDAGANVVGSNCGVGSQFTLYVVERMAEAGAHYISAQPNAGFPSRNYGRFMYQSDPAYMADRARMMIESGARIVGGCCGTTPAHIAAMHDRIKDLNAPAERRVVVQAGRSLEKKPEQYQTIEPTPLAQAIGHRFVVSVEVDPPRSINPVKDLEGARLLKEQGITTVNVADSPTGRVRMSALSMATLIHQQLGLDTIIHFTTRDRNLMGLQGDLLGAHVLGVRNILALTGDPPRQGNYPNTKAVWDVDSIGLIRLIRRLNEGYDLAGNTIGQPTNFLIGMALDMDAPDLDNEIKRFEQKVEAGAHFIMSQPIYDAEVLERFEKRVGKLPLPHLLGILPLQNHRHAEFLHNEVPGINIPLQIRQRMQMAGRDGKEEGILVAQALLLALQTRVQGTYLMPSFGRYEVCAEVLKVLNLKPEIIDAY